MYHLPFLLLLKSLCFCDPIQLLPYSIKQFQVEEIAELDIRSSYT